MTGRSRMRTVIGFTVGGLFGLFVVLVIIGAVVGPQTSSPAASNSPLPTTTTTTPLPTTTPAPAVAFAPPAPIAVPVARVIDGDTFVVGTDSIRVLGIDSCEASTDAGPAATSEATALLDAGPVVLTTEPGVDRDPYGRLLRYVRLSDGRDFGTVMVAETHTAVYAGRNDASAAYVASLRAADPNGRTCDLPDPPAPAPDTYVDTPDPDTYVPLPDPDRHTGHSGHPCLPGERDGDHDGYCGEGR